MCLLCCLDLGLQRNERDTAFNDGSIGQLNQVGARRGHKPDLSSVPYPSNTVSESQFQHTLPPYLQSLAALIQEPSSLLGDQSPSKIRFPSKRMTMMEMRKRVRTILEFIGRAQVENLHISKRQDRLGLLASDSVPASAGLMQNLTNSLLNWQDEFGSSYAMKRVDGPAEQENMI